MTASTTKGGNRKVKYLILINTPLKKRLTNNLKLEIKLKEYWRKKSYIYTYLYLYIYNARKKLNIKAVTSEEVKCLSDTSNNDDTNSYNPISANSWIILAFSAKKIIKYFAYRVEREKFKVPRMEDDSLIDKNQI